MGGFIQRPVPGPYGQKKPLEEYTKARCTGSAYSGQRKNEHQKTLRALICKVLLWEHRGVEPLTSTMRMSRANELLRANPMAVRTLTGLAIRMAFSLKTVRTGLDHPIIRNLSDN